MNETVLIAMLKTLAVLLVNLLPNEKIKAKIRKPALAVRDILTEAFPTDE